MGRQSSITQEQIVSFQQRVKEVTGWLRLRDEIAIDYLEKTDKSLSFEKREEQALSIFSEYYRTLKAPKETFSEGNTVIGLHPYDGEIINKELINNYSFMHCHPGTLPQYIGSTTFYYEILKKDSLL